MKLQVLLSVMNLNKKDLDKMNITSKCTVINQCGKEGYEKYKNYDIYSYDEKGSPNSRNRALEHVEEDIIIFCDDDIVYNKDYDKTIIEEFNKRKDADIIIFNFKSPNRRLKQNTRNRRLRFYNILRYSTYRIAIKKDSIKDLRFNTMFGSGTIYGSGEDTLFLTSALEKKIKIYSSTKYIGIVNNTDSKWFKGYNKKYFFDKGALYTAINKKHRKLLILQFLLRHKEMLNNIKFKEAHRYMLEGSEDYLKRIRKDNYEEKAKE